MKNLGTLLIFAIFSFFTLFRPIWTIQAAGPYYVDAVHGSDANNGSQASPWRTLTRALQVTTSGDTILVQPGTYNQALGEVFPLALKPNVRITGQASDTVIISGVSGKPVFNVGNKNEDFGLSTAIEKMTIQNGSVGLEIYSSQSHQANVSLSNLRVLRNEVGISISTGNVYENGAQVSVSLIDSEIKENTSHGIFLSAYGYFSRSQAALSINRVQVLNNGGDGINVLGSSTSINNSTALLSSVDSEISGNAGHGIYLLGTYSGWVKPTLTRSVLEGNGGCGMKYEDGIMGGNIDGQLTNLLIMHNEGGGLSIDTKDWWQELPSSLTVTNSTIVENSEFGIYWERINNERSDVQMKVSNTIIWNPFVDDLVTTIGSWSITDIEYSIIEDGDLAGMGGNSSADPRLQQDGYHLNACSPAMNAGNPAVAPQLDIDGEARPAGSGVDIGADEFEGACTVDVNKSVSKERIVTGSRLVYTISLSNRLKDQAVSFDLEDALDSGLEIVMDSIQANLGSTLYTGDSINWTGTLPANGSGTLIFQAGTVQAPYIIRNQAHVMAGGVPHASPVVYTYVDKANTFLPVTMNNYCNIGFRDDFSTPNSGWPVGENSIAKFGYTNGEYQVLIKQPDYHYLFRSPACLVPNYSVEMDARWASSSGDFYGVVFGMVGSFEKYYLFQVNTDYKSFALLYFDGENYQTVISPRASDAILSGTAKNHLIVTTLNRNVQLWINGVQVGSFLDGLSPNGALAVGLASGAYDNEGGADARFDNLVVTLLESKSSLGSAVNSTLFEVQGQPGSAAVSDPLLQGSPALSPESVWEAVR